MKTPFGRFATNGLKRSRGVCSFCADIYASDADNLIQSNYLIENRQYDETSDTSETTTKGSPTLDTLMPVPTADAKGPTQLPMPHLTATATS
ncbi:unnamed protein product [Caenorhabditis nigoni]